MSGEVILLHVVYNKYISKDPDIVSPDVDYARLRLEEIKKGL